MTVYKAFFKIVKSSISALITYIVIFFILTTIMATVENKDIDKNFKKTEINMTVIDRDNSQLSKGIADYLSKNQKLVPLADNKELWTDELYARNTMYILIIPENFQQNFIDGKADLLNNYQLPNSTQGTYIDMQIDQFLSTLNTYLAVDNNIASALENASKDCSKTANVSLSGSSDISDTEVKPSYYYFFQYIPFVFIYMFIIGLSPVLLTFKTPKLKQRMDCSSLSVSKRNVRLIIASLLFTIVIWIIFSILSLIEFSNIVFKKEFGLLTLNSFVFALVSLSIAYLITQFITHKNMLNSIANVVGLGSCFLCGVFVPQYLLGDSVLKISQLLPPFWYEKAIDYAFNNEISLFYKSILIELGFIIAFLGISLVLSKQKVMSKR